VTPKVTLYDCCKLPDVPVMVTVELPAGVVDEVDNVTVDVPEAVIEVGLKPAVTPLGNPLALNVTVPVNPFCALTVAV